MLPLLKIDGLETLPSPVVDTNPRPGVGADFGAAGWRGSADPPSKAALAYRTEPLLDGNLRVDPEIHLPSPGMDVDIAYFYNSNQNYAGPFGYNRNLSASLVMQAEAAATPTWVSFLRGDGSMASYVYDAASSSYLPYTGGLVNSLQRDTTNSRWIETTPGGIINAYPAVATGALSSISYAQDPVGNRQTFLYSAGALQTLMDTMGRRVTFSYVSGRLSTIKDWASRVTTFQYDSTSVAGKALMTTVIGPSGCVTGYGYDTTTPTNPRLTRITDPDGFTTTYTYDGSGRVNSQTMVGQYTTQYSYPTGASVVTYPDGGVYTNLLNSDYSVLSTQDPAGVLVTFARNFNSLEIARMNAEGAIVSTTYDAAGVTPISTTDPLGNITTYLRDAYNNPTTLIYADGGVWASIYGYAGSGFDTTGAKRQVQVQVDPLGYRTSYSYNARGQVTEAWDALNYRTSYLYDASGNMQAKVDPLGYRTTFGYDLAGNVQWVLDAKGY